MSVSTFDIVPAHARGRLQAARRMIAEMGGTSAPLVGGYLATRFGAGVPFLVYVPILLAAAVYLALAGRERRRDNRTKVQGGRIVQPVDSLTLAALPATDEVRLRVHT